MIRVYVVVYTDLTEMLSGQHLKKSSYVMISGRDSVLNLSSDLQVFELFHAFPLVHLGIITKLALKLQHQPLPPGLSM